jgi:hypothetical protein
VHATLLTILRSPTISFASFGAGKLWQLAMAYLEPKEVLTCE